MIDNFVYKESYKNISIVLEYAKIMIKPKISSRKIVVIGSVFIILIVLVGADLIISTPPAFSLENRGPAGNFTLVNQYDQNVTLNNYTGKVLVIDFIYTHCADACPIETAQMNDLMTKLMANYTSSQFHFISISFDWKFDNYSTMKAYGQTRAESRFQYWSFLSGSKNNTEQATKEYGVWDIYTNSTDPNGEVPPTTVNPPLTNNTVDYMLHELVLTIVDSHGNIRVIYPGPGWPLLKIFNDVSYLIKQENK